MPNVIVTFEGLMVFRKDNRAQVFDVGILDAKNLAAVGLPSIPDHHRTITISPSNQQFNDADIARFAAMENVWNLDVVDAAGNVRKGILPRATAAPIDRHDTDIAQHDFGWLMNIEDLHRGSLPAITPGGLKPIIRLGNGLLTTIFKTDGLDLLQGPAGNTRTTPFGFVGETAGLEITLNANEALVMRVGATEIFRVTRNSSITIENVAPSHAMPMPMPMPTATDHFQAYYVKLFPGIGPADRFRLQLHNPVERSPNHPRTIDPFKCGGITTGDGDGPLS